MYCFLYILIVTLYFLKGHPPLKYLDCATEGSKRDKWFHCTANYKFQVILILNVILSRGEALTISIKHCV